MASSTDIFPNLLPALWRGVPMPVVEMGHKLSHSVVEHLYPDRDAGRVESTGRNPNRYRFHVAYRRALGQDVYPKQFREFVRAYADRSAGELQHPEYGVLRVRPTEGDLAWRASARDGADAQVEFVEATEDDEDFARRLGSAAPYFVVTERARQARADLTALPDDRRPSISLLDALDKATLAMQQVAGQFEMSRRSLDNLGASVARVVRAGDAIMTALERSGDPRAYPAIRSLAGLLDAAARSAQELTGRAIRVRRVPRAMPVADAALMIGNTVEDFLRLNPRYAATGRVPAGASVYARG